MTEAKSGTIVPLFEMPKFEMPKFDMPSFDMPAAFREFAEKSIAQTKDNYEKVKAAAEEATETLETVYSTASKGTNEYAQKVIAVARANANATFDFIESLFDVKSPSEFVELSTSHARSRFETLSTQGKELAALAQKVATDTAEPVKNGFEKAIKKVA